MIEGIPLGVGNLSAVAVLVIVYFLIVVGRLVPKIFYDAKAKEADDWKEAYQNEREARGLAERQNHELLELAKTTDSFVRAVFTNSAREGATDAVRSDSVKETSP